MKNKVIIFLLSFFCVFSSYGQTTVVKMEQDGGVFTVPCKVNGLSMRFIFDTGASTVCISATEALFMLKNGYLSPSDIKGRNYSQVANGDIVEGMTVNLREVEIGGLPLKNVEASVVKSLSAPLLFGQTAIRKLGPIKLDGDKLIIGKVSVLNEEQLKKKALELNSKAFYAGESGQYEEAIKLYNEANEIYPLANSYDGLVSIYDKIGNFDLALKASAQAVSLEPNNLSYTYNYAVELFQTKKYDNSIRFFKEVWNLGTGNPLSNEEVMLVGNACNYLGDIYMIKEMTSSASEWFHKANKILRNDAHSYLNLGDIAFDSAQYKKAIDYMKVGVSIEPNRPSNLPRYYKIGISFKELETIDSSMVYYEKAIKCYERNKKYCSKDENDYDGYKLYVYAMESYLEQARTMFGLVSAQASNNQEFNRQAYAFPNHYYQCVYKDGYGINNGRKGAFTEDDFGKWLAAAINAQDSSSVRTSLQFLGKNYPRNINFLYVISMLSSDDSKESLSKHIPMYKAILRIFPHFYMDSKPNILNNLAWAQCCTGDYVNAEINSSQAIKMDEEDPNKWETYGESLYYQGKYKQCIEAMTKCIDLSVNNDNSGEWLKGAYKLRGESYIKTGKDSKGNIDLQKSSQL